MFGDASVYTFTLYTRHQSARARACAGWAKGGMMLLFGITVVVEAFRKAWFGAVPAADWMGTVGLLALTTNAVCFALIYHHRSDDLNMRSSWLCWRNDLIASVVFDSCMNLYG